MLRHWSVLVFFFQTDLFWHSLCPDRNSQNLFFKLKASLSPPFAIFLLNVPTQVQYCCQQLLSECLEDIEFFTAMFDKECKSRLQLVAETPFKRLTYTEAINILKDKVKSKQVKFEADVEWGM